MAAEPKTRPTRASVKRFLDAVEDPRKREDAHTVCALMERLSGEKPVMWGEAIVGFGRIPLTYASGRSLEWPVIGFSPRKQALTLYITTGFDRAPALLAKLGKHTISKACLYIKRLSDVDMKVLETLIKRSIAETRARCG